MIIKTKMHIFKFNTILIIFLPFFLFGCGGGGGGGGVSTVNYTPEYNNQTGLEMIGASAANLSGYTGSGVKVSVVDTGIETSHSEFSGITFSGNSYVSGKSQYDDVHGHGSHVAGIIAARRDAVGMRGVAYGVTSIMSQRIMNDSGAASLSDSVWASIITAEKNASVDFSNNSWGSSSIEIDEINSTWINNNLSSTASAYQSAVSNDVVYVWATGNNYGVDPSYQSGLPAVVDNIEDGWVAVMSLNGSKKETNYTQRCGDAAAWCVAAPGGGDTQSTQGIYSVKSSGGYVRYSGTSMAAPHVTGMLALIKDRFSASLTNKQVRTRLLNGATYSGLVTSNGDLASSLTTSQKEAIFGKGLINYGNSISQIGSLNYPASNNFYNGNNTNIDNSKIQLPLSLYNNLANEIADLDVMAFDSFDGADFTVKGSKIFDTNKSKKVSLFGYSNEPNKINNSRVGYFNNNLNYFVSNDLEIIQKDKWGSKNNFVQKFFNDLNTQYSNLEFPLYGSQLSYFIQYPNINNRYNTHTYGTNFNQNFNDSKFNILLNYSVHNNIISNYSVIKNNNTLTDSRSMDLGFIYSLSNRFDIFARHKRDYLKTDQATNHNFSINSGYASSEVIGLEYSKGSQQLNFGLYTPTHFKNSEFSLMTPSGKGADGTIYWQEKKILVDNQIHLSPYISYKAKIANILPLFSDNSILINLMQSPYNNKIFESGEILFSTKF
jgi:subtilase-type serine protease